MSNSAKSNYILFLIFIVPFLFVCCNSNITENKPRTKEEITRQEARDDSLELVAAYARQAKITHTIQPTLETDAVVSQASLDAADDPAVWVHPSDPARSIIIGSNKKGGLHLYGLSGKELAYFPVGNINNVDVLAGFQLGDQKVSLIGGSNRSDQSIDLFIIDPEGPELIDIAAGTLATDTTKVDDIYGFCFYQDTKKDLSYVFINGKNGRLQQFELVVNENNQVTTQLVREVQFEGQVEGMVADNEYEILYVGEEDHGIWRLSASPDGGDHKQLIPLSTEENPDISFDIEGLALYKKWNEGYLIASSQGNFSYAVFDRKEPNTYITSFVIKANGEIDGVEETDGIEAINLPFGKAFPEGIFIAQDGFNYKGDSLEAQNFKIIDWRVISNLLVDLEMKP